MPCEVLVFTAEKEVIKRKFSEARLILKKNKNVNSNHANSPVLRFRRFITEGMFKKPLVDFFF